MSAYDEAAEKAVKQVITQYFEHHPVLSDTSVAENLAGLLNSDNEKIRLGAIKMWSVLRAMKPREEEQDAPRMEEILRAESQQKASENAHKDVIYVDERQLAILSEHLTPEQRWERICAPGVKADGGHRGSH